MKQIHFNNYKDLASDISDKYDSLKSDDEYKDVSVIAKYEESRHIVKELLFIGYDIHSILMHDVEYDGYDNEYIISLFDNEIWVEPMLRDNGYISDDSPIMYVLDNCSSKVIPYCKGKTVYEVAIGEEETEREENYSINGEVATKEEFDAYTSQFKKTEDNEESDCDECECACNEGEKLTTSTTTYRVNGKEVDRETYEKALNELDEKYLDNVQDMLMNYFDFVSEMNQWRRLFW